VKFSFPSGLILLILLGPLWTSNAFAGTCPNDLRAYTPDAIVTELTSNRPVFLECARVTGDLVIPPDRGELPALFLIDSVVDGSVVAKFVRFSGPVRLDGTIVRGEMVLRAAVFEDEVNWPGAQIEGPLNASNARFNAPADLRAQAYASADFSDASFAQRTLFLVSNFKGVASFVRAIFQNDTSFRGAFFRSEANFEGATALASVDFGGSHFWGDAILKSLSVKGVLDLRRGDFLCNVNLDGVSVGSLDVSRSKFDDQSTTCGSNASSPRTLRMDTISAGSLQMNLSLVDRLPTVQRDDVLRVIERSARARGDTSLANQALFKRESLLTRGKTGTDHTYRTGLEVTTGYLVRPTRPLFFIAALLLIGFVGRLAFLNAAFLGSLRGNKPSVSTSKTRLSLIAPDSIPQAAIQSVGAALNPKPPAELDAERNKRPYRVFALLWIEYLLEKTFLVIFLISLGNANPTLREIITSIR
jgi:Pentapeptide repeats (9 copies)